MDYNVSLKNSYNNTMSPELEHRLQSQENFTALDREKLKQDTVEITNKAKDYTEENASNSVLKGMFGIDLSNPKKTAISVACAIATVIGVAILGNKLKKPALNLGYKIDEFLTGDNIIGKARNAVAGVFSKGKDAIVKKVNNPNSNSKTVNLIRNIKKSLDNPAKPKWTIFRGFENGAKGLFSNTVVETITTAIEQDSSKAYETFTNLLGGDAKLAEKLMNELYEESGKVDKVKFVNNLINKIAEKNNCVNDKKALGMVFRKLSEGGFGDGLTGIKMDKGGVMGAWWPANAINSVFKKITGRDNKYLLGDLGDSLEKVAAVRGRLAKTLPAKIVQVTPPLVGDYVSNFVNDKSGFGIFLCLNLVGNFNNLQDTPNNKKVSTALNDVASGSMSWLFGMPIAYSAVYSLASLRNLEGKGIVTRLIRRVGKIAGMGLDKPGTLGGLKGILGGIGRFAVVFLILQPMVSRFINKITAKVFGKPYDKDEEMRKQQEEEQQKKIEEAKKQVIPELGITQGEFLERIQNNPEAAQKIQQNPELAKAIEKNPKLILDLLDGKDVEIPKTQAQQGNLTSPINQSLINRNISNLSQERELFSSKSKEKEKEKQQEEAPSQDVATYIPSSKPVEVTEFLSKEQKESYDDIMAKADKALKNAEKLI